METKRWEGGAEGSPPPHTPGLVGDLDRGQEPRFKDVPRWIKGLGLTINDGNPIVRRKRGLGVIIYLGYLILVQETLFGLCDSG